MMPVTRVMMKSRSNVIPTLAFDFCVAILMMFYGVFVRLHVDVDD